jgi:hypothetical protein
MMAAMGHINLSGHGYPDPGYLDNVLHELAAHGVYSNDAIEVGSGPSRRREEGGVNNDEDTGEDEEEDGEEEGDDHSSHWAHDGVLYQEVC